MIYADKLEKIIYELNHTKKIPDDAINDALTALNMVLLLLQEDETPPVKDDFDEKFRFHTLADLRHKVGITQSSLAQRIRERGRSAGLQGEVLKIERGYNSPTVSRLNDYLEALGFTLEMIASNDSGFYLMDVGALTRSRTKDARKKDSEV